MTTHPHKSQQRHRCRNPHCRGKLKEPTDNARRAFCTQTCHAVFYRSRCVVCEEKFRRKNEKQHVCGRYDCKKELRRFPNAYVLLSTRGSANVIGPAKKADKSGLKTCTKSLPGWQWVKLPGAHDDWQLLGVGAR